MTLTLICDLDMRFRPRYFSNLRNYSTPIHLPSPDRVSGTAFLLPKTTEQHLIVRSGKSEAEVTTNGRVQCTFLLCCTYLALGLQV